MKAKQVPVADVFRKFADMVDDPHLLPVRAKVDPGRKVLASILDALGKYAAEMGTDLRWLNERVGGAAFWEGNPPKLGRRLTDEVRRFADMVEKKRDLIRVVDPGHRRLTSAIKAVNIYALRLGVDMGLSRAWAVVPEEVKHGT